MKNLGRKLSGKEQKEIKGGNIGNIGGMFCRSHQDCWNASPYLGPGDVSCRSSNGSGEDGYYNFGQRGNKVCVFN